MDYINKSNINTAVSPEELKNMVGIKYDDIKHLPDHPIEAVIPITSLPDARVFSKSQHER
jgi:hypothetical protein